MTHKSDHVSPVRLVLGALAAIAFMFAGSVGAAGAQDDYTSAPTATIEGTIGPGETITVTGTGNPGDLVILGIGTESFGEGIVGEDGTFTITATIPADLAPGSFEVTVQVGGIQVVSTGFVVPQTTPTTTANSGSLPKTGSDNTLGMTQVGVALLAGGALLLLARRRSARS